MQDGRYRNKLILGDTLATLKTLPVDLVDLTITSPPYNKQEKNKGALVDKVIYENSTDSMPEGEYQNSQIEVIDEIYRISKPGSSLFYNHKIRWDDGYMHHPLDWLRSTQWHIRQEIVWDRILAANIRGWRFWQVEERIYWLIKPEGGNLKGRELASKDAKLSSIWRGMPETNNEHPAPFPLWLPARAIISMSQSDNRMLVLDPYSGSGTTATAAKLLNHDYIGIDSSPAYLKMAQIRIENCATEIEQLNQEIELHNVNKTSQQRKTEIDARKANNPSLF